MKINVLFTIVKLNLGSTAKRNVHTINDSINCLRVQFSSNGLLIRKKSFVLPVDVEPCKAAAVRDTK